MKAYMRNPSGGVVVFCFFKKLFKLCWLFIFVSCVVCVREEGGGARASDEVASARFYERRSREGACEIFLPPNKSGFDHALAPYY